MPLFIAAVVGLSFILLLIAFRSLVIPLTAAVMNLLAAAGSFGRSWPSSSRVAVRGSAGRARPIEASTR